MHDWKPTWFEEDDGLHAGKLCRVNVELTEDLQTGAEECEGLAERAGEVGELTGGEYCLGGGGRVWAGAPLDGAEQEQLGPALLQQGGLVALGQG